LSTLKFIREGFCEENLAKKDEYHAIPYGIISPLKKAKWRGRVVWLIAHAWNVCNLHGFAGSNPALSATKVKDTKIRVLDFLMPVLYFGRFSIMKKLSSQSRTVLFVIIGVALAFLSAAFGSGAAISQNAAPTPTPTPPTLDIDLDVGSTDGILIWAFLIALIIIVPILWNLFFLAREKE
jgi:hypothetical protein